MAYNQYSLQHWAFIQSYFCLKWVVFRSCLESAYPRHAAKHAAASGGGSGAVRHSAANSGASGRASKAVADEIRPGTRLPTHAMRSTGMFCTLYSRCSLAMVQSVRFFCIISSSRSRRPLSQSLYQRSSQSQISGLSVKNYCNSLISLKNILPIWRSIKSQKGFIEVKRTSWHRRG